MRRNGRRAAIVALVAAVLMLPSITGADDDSVRRAEDAASRAETAAQRSEAAAARTEKAIERIERLLDALARQQEHGRPAPR